MEEKVFNEKFFLEKAVRWLKEEKYSQKKLSQKKLDQYLKQDLLRIKRGEPIDYIIGFSYFLNTKIDLKYRPFIPRDETEYWVEQSFSEIRERIKNNSQEIKCLDIFAGSGCIGIALLKNFPSIKVDFIEKNKNFLKQIRINLKLNHIDTKRSRLIQSDVFSQLKKKKRSDYLYDYIFANPPYLSRKRKNNKNKKNKINSNVLKWEPSQALFSGGDGLFCIKKFFKEAKEFLKAEGKIYLEFDSWEKKDIEKIIKNYNYSSLRFFKDQYNKWRYLSCSFENNK